MRRLAGKQIDKACFCNPFFYDGNIGDVKILFFIRCNRTDPENVYLRSRRFFSIISCRTWLMASPMARVSGIFNPGLSGLEALYPAIVPVQIASVWPTKRPASFQRTDAAAMHRNAGYPALQKDVDTPVRQKLSNSRLNGGHVVETGMPVSPAESQVPPAKPEVLDLLV